MDIKEARKILAEDFTHMSDPEIEALIDLIEGVVRYIIISEFREEMDLDDPDGCKFHNGLDF